MDDAEVQILLEWKERGRETLEANKLALAEMNAALSYRDALRAAGVIATDAETVATQTNTVATEENATAQEQEAGILSTSTIPAIWAQTQAVWGALPAWAQWTVGIGAVLATLAPFVILVGSAAVILTTFAVGAAGAAVAMGGLALAVVGLGAGLVLLADHFAWVNSPMAKLKDALNEMGGDLAQLAAGPAAAFIHLLRVDMVPAVEAIGRGLIGWTAARLPEMLQLLASMGGSALGGLTQVGNAIGGAFDKLGTGTVAAMFQQFTNFGAGAIVGLIQNLTALSQWFEQRLPTYGPIASQIFGAIGQAVQGVAYWWGQFSGFLVSQWPTITDNANRAVKSIGDAWNVWAPVAQAMMAQILPALGPAIQNVSDHMGVWVPVILSVATAILAVATAIITTIGWLEQFIGWIETAQQDWDGFMKSTGNAPNGAAVAASSSGRGHPGGTQISGAKASVVINVNGASQPEVTSAVIARNLRKLGAV